MSSVVKKTVDCVRDGKVIAGYRLSYGVTAAPPDLIKEARDTLINQGLVKPPFDFTRISFKIRDGW